MKINLGIPIIKLGREGEGWGFRYKSKGGGVGEGDREEGGEGEMERLIYYHQLKTVGTGRRHIVERARERGDERKT